MGREIRRVPATWEHPKDEKGVYLSIYDEPYDEALDKWIEGRRQWQCGEHEDQKDGSAASVAFYDDWYGRAPDPDTYRRESWTEDEATHWVMYENVSEGSPLTPAFGTREELVDYLCTQRNFWRQGPISREAAEAFTRSGYAPSFVLTQSTGLVSGLDAAGLSKSA